MQDVLNLVVNKSTLKGTIYFSTVLSSILFTCFCLLGAFCFWPVSPQKLSMPYNLPGYVGKLQQDAAVMSTLEKFLRVGAWWFSRFLGGFVVELSFCEWHPC